MESVQKSIDLVPGAVGGALDASSSLVDSGYANSTSLTLTDDSVAEDPELEAMEARVREMEEESERLRKLQSEVEKKMNLGAPTPAVQPPTFPTQEEKIEADGRSVYVGNVDYGATAEELERHFHSCGAVNRVTIQCDKFTGHPKGFAYVEFTHKDCVAAAVNLDGSVLRGRQIKVNPKRTNRPGISSTNRGRSRARGGGGDRGGRGGAGGQGRGVYNGASYSGGDRGMTAGYGGSGVVAAGYGGDQGVTSGFSTGYNAGQASYNAGQAVYNAGQTAYNTNYAEFVPGGYAAGFTARTRPGVGHIRGRTNLCS